ncbi:transporter [Streptomyces sp. NPDC091416]|uniref:transporter n=1 Tax=Streptomyces sp. NPDC091416 TaxID=3366003 RepID=UPI0038060A75
MQKSRQTTGDPFGAPAPDDPAVARIRALSERREAQGRPLTYEHLPEILNGSRPPCSTDLACIADEAEIYVHLLLGTHPRRIVLTYADLWMAR